MRATLLFAAWMYVFALSESGWTSYGGELTASLPVAEDPHQRAIDEYVNSEMESQRIPGLSMAVVQTGKLVQAKGYGKASLELDAPATTSTLYGLGSISKQFTATAIMLLAEEGKIGLDHRLTNYFRWLPKEWDEVTVRHLLTHTSGIRQEQWKDGIVEFDRFEHEQEEIVKTAFGPMLARPGEKFAYSNLGYRILGMLVEKASGESYWDFLASRIFHPVGMKATRNSDPKTVILNRSRGYGISRGKYENREPVTASAAFSEGALISSVLDMVKWDAALNSEGLLKKTSLEQMWTPVLLNDATTFKYGFGWFLRPVPGHRTVAHGGALPGFSTFIWRFIDDKLTVIVLCNCEAADTGRIGLGVAGLYVPALLSPEIKKQL
jgi:D-alanyl-D-alanine carboxypeptidase